MNQSIWSISDKKWPKDSSDREKLKFLLQFAILAPSGHNTQPWLFRICGNTLELYADRTRCLPVVDPEDRELLMSCGCSLYFLSIAARKYSLRTQIEEFPDSLSPDLLARISLVPSEPATNDELDSFNAIFKRHTNREAFEERHPTKEILERVIGTVGKENTWVHLITENDKRKKTSDLIAQGDRIQASDKHFRRELSSWVHSNRSMYSDGMPGYAFGVGDLASNLGPFILRTFNWGNGQAAKDQQLALGSPVLAVLGTKFDTPVSWLNAGQALGMLLINATIEGLSASFLNQPIEVEELRKQLQELIDVDGYPQILLRIGYGAEVKPTPRRGISEVLIEDENG